MSLSPHESAPPRRRRAMYGASARHPGVARARRRCARAPGHRQPPLRGVQRRGRGARGLPRRAPVRALCSRNCRNKIETGRVRRDRSRPGLGGPFAAPPPSTPRSDPGIFSWRRHRRAPSAVAARGLPPLAEQRALECDDRQFPIDRAFDGKLGSERTPYARMTSEPKEQYLCIVSTASSGYPGQPRERAHGSPDRRGDE